MNALFCVMFLRSVLVFVPLARKVFLSFLFIVDSSFLH